MKILVIHNDYMFPGGERIVVEAEAELLQSNGHEVINYSRSNAEIEDYGLLKKLLFFPQAIFSVKTYNNIRTLVKESQPDIAHVHNVFPLISPSVYYALRNADIPIVQTIHNFRFLCPNGLFYTNGSVCERCIHGNTLHAIRWKCYRESYPLSVIYASTIGIHRLINTFKLISTYIVLSNFTKNKLVESGVAPSEIIHVLSNYLPTAHNTRVDLKKTEPYFVFMGRLSAEKGLEFLLRAAMAKLPNGHLLVLGDGPEKDHLLSYAAELGLQNVDFLGFVDGDKKETILKNAIALILPSTCYENFPLAVLESYSVGTPVIASKLGSIPELVIDGQSGLLFTPGNSDELQEKMLHLMTNPSESIRLGQAAVQFATDKYSANIHYKNLVKIYDLCLTQS